MLGLLIASVRILWKHLRPAGAAISTGSDTASRRHSSASFSVRPPSSCSSDWCSFFACTKPAPSPPALRSGSATLKPHLFLPFALVLLVWIVVSRSYRILAGGVAAFALGGLVTACIDPAAWSQYAYYMRTSVVTHEFTPCLGDLLRDSINPAAEWLAFVPAVLGCIWALAYFWPRRHTWDWLENGSLLMLVSLLVAPFGWIFDQSLAIPADALRRVARPVPSSCSRVLALIYLLIEFQIGLPVRAALALLISGSPRRGSSGMLLARACSRPRSPRRFELLQLECYRGCSPDSCAGAGSISTRVPAFGARLREIVPAGSSSTLCAAEACRQAPWAHVVSHLLHLMLAGPGKQDRWGSA